MKKAFVIAFLAALFTVAAGAGTIPSGYTCAGNCGTDGADGVVPLSPAGSAQYEWISTTKGVTGIGVLPSGSLGSEVDGSTLATPVFAATAGASLNFYVDYVTSDGGGYADYAWAELFSSKGTPEALLFTLRSQASGSIVPGTGMPAPTATLNPSSVPIHGGAPAWSPLGTSSDTCYGSGCGYSGWIDSNYTIGTAGSYYLEVGVANWLDRNFDSGLAMDGVKVVGGLAGTPEPGTLLLIGTGLGITALVRRRRRA